MQGVKAKAYTLEKSGYTNSTETNTEFLQKDVPYNIAYLLNSEVVETVFLAAFQESVFQEKPLLLSQFSI